jgi:hypothetical protein
LQIALMPGDNCALSAWDTYAILCSYCVAVYVLIIAVWAFGVNQKMCCFYATFTAAFPVWILYFDPV